MLLAAADLAYIEVQFTPLGPNWSWHLLIVALLTGSLDRAAAEDPDPGRTDTFRRLNRTEYQNAIRDLVYHAGSPLIHRVLHAGEPVPRDTN